jgi:hypothetical protein
MALTTIRTAIVTIVVSVLLIEGPPVVPLHLALLPLYVVAQRRTRV